ncbi:MAG: hypothetical protein R6W76_15685 [Caldilinea sp.]
MSRAALLPSLRALGGFCGRQPQRCHGSVLRAHALACWLPLCNHRAMNGLSIRLLGSPHIELDGRPAALETRKATALLAYLAVRLSKAFGRTPEG